MYTLNLKLNLSFSYWWYLFVQITQSKATLKKNWKWNGTERELKETRALFPGFRLLPAPFWKR